MSYLYKVVLPMDDVQLACLEAKLNVNEKVIIKVDEDEYLGVISSCEELSSSSPDDIYWDIVRVATKEDIETELENRKEAESLIETIQKSADNLDLSMRVFRVNFTLNRQKIHIIYTADQRVDFRELLKVLARLLKCRIDMRQVGSRDKAKMVGGIGVCGLELCCSKFLKNMEGITIAMAKNQMLAINIPKLSGQCGKLMCCLKFEDDAYTSVKQYYPKIGTEVSYEGENMKVDSYNVLSRTVTLKGEERYQSLSLEDYRRIEKGLKVVKRENRDSNDELESISKAISNTFGSSPIEKEKYHNEFKDNRNDFNKSNNNQNRQNNNRNNNDNQRNNHNNNKKKRFNNNHKHYRFINPDEINNSNPKGGKKK